MCNKDILMKKIVLLIVMVLAVTSTTLGQNDSTNKTKVEIRGGVFVGANQQTKFIGLPGPKISTTFLLGNSSKIEIGAMGIPGVIITSDQSKLGMVMGGAITLHSKKTIKPMVGLMFTKTDTGWSPLFGLGFSF